MYLKQERQCSLLGGARDTLISSIILLHENFCKLIGLRAVVFQLNLKYLHVKITKPLRVVV